MPARVRVDGAEITALPPARRDIGMVFQNYALFPASHRAGNVAFPLEMRNVGARRDRAARGARRWRWSSSRATRRGCPGSSRAASSSAWRWPAPSSSIRACCCSTSRSARSTASCARPCSSRSAACSAGSGLTTIFITHDQEEALVLSDRIAVMNKGTIQQIATTTEIYERPANDFVADFVGESNIFHGTLTEPGVGHAVGRPAAAGERRARGGVGERPVGVLMRPERFAASGANTLRRRGARGGLSRRLVQASAGLHRRARTARPPARARPAAGCRPDASRSASTRTRSMCSKLGARHSSGASVMTYERHWSRRARRAMSTIASGRRCRRSSSCSPSSSFRSCACWASASRRARSTGTPRRWARGSTCRCSGTPSRSRCWSPASACCWAIRWAS